eukprot:GHVS01107436.1.p1 GENE.GHVS01107436.1~~GHVS01107436.1.p1  ORF type:complete len:243 (+),score=41.45 GHVS01107436.1:199-927(+)
MRKVRQTTRRTNKQHSQALLSSSPIGSSSLIPTSRVLPFRLATPQLTCPFAVSVDSPSVQDNAQRFVATLGVPKPVGQRLALLQEMNTEASLLDFYVDAIRHFQSGVSLTKVCRSGRMRPRSLSSEPDCLVLTGRRVDRIALVDVVDVVPGNFDSDEFKLVRKKLKNDPAEIDRRIPRDHSCVLLTKDRTYSFVCRPSGDGVAVDELCAFVDVFKGLHGPAVWKSMATDQIFAHPKLQADFY